MSNELQYYTFIKTKDEKKECDKCGDCYKKDTDDCCKKKGKCSVCIWKRGEKK